MKILTKIIGTFALAGLAFLPSCESKAKQEAEKQMLEQKIELYDKLTASYDEKNKASVELEAKKVLAECREDLIDALEFQVQYITDEDTYRQTLRLIDIYNSGLENDAHKSDLAGLHRINRYLGKVKEYNQSRSTRSDILKKAIPKPELQELENSASNFEIVIKKAKECQSCLELIEGFTKEDSSYLAAVIQYSKSKSDVESEKACGLAKALCKDRERTCRAASDYKENLARSIKKFQDTFAGQVSEFLPEKKEDTVHKY